MGALRDLTENAEPGTFSYVLAQKIMAMEATIEELESHIIKLYNSTKTSYIELNGETGIIKSSNYDPNSAGWAIKGNGDTEFNNSVFSGTLQARYISITGEVTAGDGFVLRTNNTPMAVPHNDNAWHYLKSITTFARGSCKIKLGFEYGNMGGSVGYRLYRNGILFGTYDAVTTTSVVMPLIASQTTIGLMGRHIPPIARPAMSISFSITDFGLWVEFDPGILGAFGY